MTGDLEEYESLDCEGFDEGLGRDKLDLVGEVGDEDDGSTDIRSISSRNRSRSRSAWLPALLALSCSIPLSKFAPSVRRLLTYCSMFFSRHPTVCFISE